MVAIVGNGIGFGFGLGFGFRKEGFRLKKLSEPLIFILHAVLYRLTVQYIYILYFVEVTTKCQNPFSVVKIKPSEQRK
jgi:hypothetical protein